MTEDDFGPGLDIDAEARRRFVIGAMLAVAVMTLFCSCVAGALIGLLL
jgi:hypothetical protein